MGYLLRTKCNAEKSQACCILRENGLSHMPTPFRTLGHSMNTLCVFDDHFYSAHWEQVDAVMEDEEMLEVRTIKELMSILKP